MRIATSPGAETGGRARARRLGGALRALPSLLLAAFPAAPVAPAAQEPVARPVVLVAPHVQARVDPADPRLRLFDVEGRPIATLPLGLRLRPAGAEGHWLLPSPEIVVPLQERERPAPEEGEIEADTVLLGLVDPEGRTRATCAVRAVAWGVHVVFDLPQSAFAEVEAPAGLAVVREAGVAFEPGGGLSLADGERLEFEARALPLGRPLEHHRLELKVRGRGALAVRLDGRSLGIAPPSEDGAPRTADLALAPGERLVLAAEGDVLVEKAVLVARGGEAVSLLERVRLAQEGIDLFEAPGEPPALAPALPPPPALVDVRRSRVPFSPPPLAVAAQGGSARLVVALDRLPPALRFGFERGHLGLDLPTRAMASAPPNPALERTLSLGLSLFLAGSPDETGSRLRTRLLVTGGAPWIDEERIVDPAPAARLPAVFLDAGERRIDARRASFLLEGAAASLGCDRFTVVVRGPWMRTPGDPFPSQRFGDPRPLVTTQHVAGRPVLFEWPLLEAAPGSAAESLGAAEGGLVRARSLSRARRFFHEVARYVVGEGLDVLGADGLLVTGLERAPRPPPGRWPETGGVRDLGVLLDLLGRDLRATADERKVTLAAPGLLPQALRALDVVLCDPWSLPPERRDAWLRLALALAPDATLLFAPPPGTPDPLALARLAVVGRPALTLEQVRRLDDRSARVVGAVFRFAAERPSGVGGFDATTGGWSLRVGERRRAWEVGGGRALFLVDGPDSVRVFAIAGGPIPLPFAARVEPPIEGVEVAGDPPVLRGLAAGEEARLAR